MFNMAGMQLPDYLKGKEVESAEVIEENKNNDKK
jgi:hypothetical protein